MYKTEQSPDGQPGLRVLMPPLPSAREEVTIQLGLEPNVAKKTGPPGSKKFHEKNSMIISFSLSFQPEHTEIKLEGFKLLSPNRFIQVRLRHGR